MTAHHEPTRTQGRAGRLLPGQRVVGGAALGVAVALLVAGCTSGSGEAGPTTAAAVGTAVTTPAATLSGTPSPTATPTGSTKASGAPKRPAGMNANTAEGARKTALYFLQLYPYVMRTGDTKEWDRLSVAKQCGFCSDVRSKAVSKRKRLQVYSGGEISAKVVTTYDRDTLYGGYPLDVSISQHASVTHDRDGKVVATGKANSSLLTVDVLRASKGWKILEIGTAGND